MENLFKRHSWGYTAYYLDEALTIPHRLNGPAVIYESGEKEWYVNGVRHRVDGPARQCSNGDEEWFVNGVLHRVDGPAAKYSDGYRCWYFLGKLHREDGPAIYKDDNSILEWYIDGKRHRLDGPAYIQRGYPPRWYIDGRDLVEEEYYKIVAKPWLFDRMKHKEAYNTDHITLLDLL